LEHTRYHILGKISEDLQRKLRLRCNDLRCEGSRYHILAKLSEDLQYKFSHYVMACYNVEGTRQAQVVFYFVII